MRNRLTFALAVLLSMAVAAATTLAMTRVAPFSSFQPVAGAVYTMSNDAAANSILTFDRLVDGRLVQSNSVATGGTGTGAGLGNQGGVTLSRDERWLMAVNAGSDSVSVFRVGHGSLHLTAVGPSGGTLPVSVTEHRGLIYVLNAGSDSIAGFTLERDGDLHPLPDSIRSLSGAGTGPAQISFSPDGDLLAVTEKATNRIVTFEIDRSGRPGPARVQPSTGVTPFGFAFGKRRQLFVSEAFGGAPDASAATSYAVGASGLLTTVSASVGTNQTALCWLVVTPDGRFLYGTNTGSGSISGYRIAFDGQIELLDADGRTAVTGDGSSPIDLALTNNGRFLYSLNGGANSIGAFRVESDGSLESLPFAGGLPTGANGLAAR